MSSKEVTFLYLKNRFFYSQIHNLVARNKITQEFLNDQLYNFKISVPSNQATQFLKKKKINCFLKKRV